MRFSISVDYADNCWHRWTIEDAKDGDVLYSLDSCQPFIYKGRKSHEQATAYCGINKYDKFFVEKTEDYIIVLDKYVPATKEQRDFLFRKMKEAGYEWDAEKKELKKIDSIFPFQAKIKQTGKIITIIAGQLDMEGKKYIQYQSDKNDGYSVYNPNDFEKLNC